MSLTELNVNFKSSDEQIILEVINYISSGSPKISSIGLLRDGLHLVNIISIYERQTQWQSSRVIDLFFKYKNDVINCYSFINGWIDTYYNCGYDIVGDDLRFANNQNVIIIALLVLNVLYVKRQSLTNDLRIRLEALWIDFNSIVDSIILWIRTRAQLLDSDSSLHSHAHQLFSGQSLFEYQSIQQRLTSMVQQKLIDDQSKKLEEKELFIQKQTKDYSELGTKMLAIIEELNEMKKSNEILNEEVNWQKGINYELNDRIVKLKEENNVLKKLFVKQNGILNGTQLVNNDDNNNNDICEKTETIVTYDTRDTDDTELKLSQDDTSDENFESSCELLLDTLDQRDSNLNDLNIGLSFNTNTDSIVDNNCGLHIDCNIIGITEKPEDTDSSTETEDITDSGNHSDSATDDILVEIYQCCQQSNEHNINNSTDTDKEKVFNFNSWQEFFANDSNNDHDFENGQQIDTYNKSNQRLGTNDNRICINFI